MHRLLDALVDGGPEALRDHAADDLVDELVALMPRQGLDRDVAVAELASPAGLLLVARPRAGRLADRLEVGHARRVGDDLDAEAALDALDGDIDVHLREAVDEQLRGPLVARDPHRRILLREPAQGLSHLVVLATYGRLDRNRDDRSRQRHALHHHRVIGDEITGDHVLQLRHGPHVAGADLGDDLVLAALHLEQLSDPLLLAGAAIDDVRVGREPPGEHAHEVDAPDVSV